MPPAALQGWQEDPLDGLAAALRRQCQMASPPDPWPALCGRLQPAQPGLKERLAQSLRAWPLTGTTTESAGLVTRDYKAGGPGGRVREGGRPGPPFPQPPPPPLAPPSVPWISRASKLVTVAPFRPP